MYDKLVAKVNNSDTSGFVLKTKYDTDKSDLEKKVTDADKNFLILVDLLKKTNYDYKISEIESKIPRISGLATNSALTAVVNKTPDVIKLVKKAGYDTKVSEVEKEVTDHDHDKYNTTSEFSKLITEKFSTR